MEIKQGCAVTFTPSRSGVKRKQVYIFSPDAIIFSASGFKIIDSSIFLELSFALRFSFCSDEACATDRETDNNKGKRKQYVTKSVCSIVTKQTCN